MKKELKNLKITKVGYGGVGIARDNEGKKILIKGGALPGSMVDIKITRKKSDYLQGHISKIHEYDKNFT
ncbi:MAG TPA: TRAM domain-containing protein, partial [Candidatus Absconditabacterales bacterium]|nr:TRAM domain-containing protein [Candidatus Absconditabacterales bacterium]